MRIIAGEARGRRIAGPTDASIRPLLDRIRESLFSALGSVEGWRVLDLFSGVGSFGLEALSRGASRVVFVERGRPALALLRQNLRSLGFAGRAEVIAGDALGTPAAGSTPGFNVVFMDPPFRMFDHADEAQSLCRRALELLESDAVEPDGLVLLRRPTRHRAELSLTAARTQRYGESVVLWLTKQSPDLDP